MVLLWHIAQAKGAGDIGQGVEQDEPAARLTVLRGEVVVCVDAREDEYRDEDAVGDLEEGGDEGGVAEAFDDDGAEVGDAPVGRVVDHAEDEEEPSLGVFEGFNDLVAFKMLVFYAGLVGTETLHGDASLAGCEEGCVDG